MLLPKQIEEIREAAGQIATGINDFLIEDICRRLAGAGQLTSSAAYQIYRAQQLGMSRKEIEKRIEKELNIGKAEIKKLLTQSAEVGYNFDISNFPPEAVPFEENTAIQQMVLSAVKMAQGDFTNIVQTMGMVAPDGRPYSLAKAYQKNMDYMFQQVFTGSTDYNTAISQAVKRLAYSGVRVIDYESGVHTSIEAAVRRNVMGGLGLIQEQISEYNHKELGADGWEISAHAASAPDHEPIQGRQYSDSDYTKLNNSLLRRIGTLNCGHAAFPIIMRVSIPQYTREELDKMAAENAKGVDYQGKHYSLYGATQKQRQIERAIRKQRKRISAFKASGKDDIAQISEIRLQRLEQEYSEFSKSAGLRKIDERMLITSNKLVNSGGNDIITLDSKEEDILMKLDFSKVSEYKGKLSDRAVRKWYKYQDEQIPTLIDTSLSVELQARQAFNLRNAHRTQARDLMRDQNERARLDREEPNKTFDELILHKMQDYGMSRDEAIADVLRTATKTRKTVNKKFGLEE